MSQINNNEKSLYKQISDQIENDILNDIILEEERAPSINELVKHYIINPATAIKGINLLVEQGILYKKRGIGMFVSTGAKDVITKRRKQEFFDTHLTILLSEATRLGIGIDEIYQAMQLLILQTTDSTKQ